MKKTLGTLKMMLGALMSLAFALSASAAFADEFTRIEEPFARSAAIYTTHPRAVYTGNEGTVNLNDMSVVKSQLWERQPTTKAFAAGPTATMTDATRAPELPTFNPLQYSPPSVGN